MARIWQGIRNYGGEKIETTRAERWIPYLIVLVGFIGGAVYIGNVSDARIRDIQAERLAREEDICEFAVHAQTGIRIMFEWAFAEFPDSAFSIEGQTQLDSDVPAIKCDENNVPVRVDTGEPLGD